MISNIRRQYHIRILNYLLSNLLWRLRFHFGWISDGGGDSHANDAIVSCAVMEHLYDPMGCLTNMIKSLKTGGTIIVHCINFRDHGMFEPRYHPLKYFTVPSTLYQLITSKSGDQNRCLLYLYRNFWKKHRKSCPSPMIFIYVCLSGD